MIEQNALSPTQEFVNSNKHAGIKNKIKKLIPSSLLKWATNSRPIVAVRSRMKNWVHRNESHDEVYGDDYFEMVDNTTGRSAEVMAASLANHLGVRKVIDMGCGTGNLISSFRKLNVETKGIEFAKSALKYCVDRGLDVVSLDFTKDEDIATPLGHYDLAVSSEVAIQLPPEAATNHIKFLCQHSDTVLFSSPPCARDRLPKSPQTAEYWQNEFLKQDFELDGELSSELKAEWEEKGTATWHHRCPMIFRRKP